MDELIKSFTEWFKEKTSSSLYFTFFVVFVISQWRFFYTLFFEDRIPEGSSRLHYAEGFLFIFDAPENWWSIIEGAVEHVSVFFLPVVVTYILVRWLPRLNNKVHEISLRFYFERKVEYYRQLEKSEKEIVLLLENIKNDRVQHDVISHELLTSKQAGFDVKRWKKEYLELQPEFRNSLAALARIPFDPRSQMYADKDVGYFFATNLILKTDPQTLSLTEKGKFFVKEYMERRSSGA